MKAREEAEQAERERHRQQKAEWIAAHGPDYLKRATTLGYDCQRQYVAERAALELPGFEVDFDNRAAWKSHSCPSEEALAEVESLIVAGHQASVVWLNRHPHQVGWEPCEAIVISNYLDRYYLVKVV